MDFLEWFDSHDALSAALLSSLLTFISSYVIFFRGKLFEHRLNLKMAKLAEDSRKNETELSVILSAHLNALAERQIAINQRRLEAIDRIWLAALTFKGFTEVASQIKLDPKNNSGFTRAVDLKCDLNSFKVAGEAAERVRPYVTTPVWATYQAFSVISSIVVDKWQSKQANYKGDGLVTEADLMELIAMVIPKFSTNDYFDNYAQVFWELESKLLADIQIMMSGADLDEASIEQAAKIIIATNKMHTCIKQASTH